MSRARARRTRASGAAIADHVGRKPDRQQRTTSRALTDLLSVRVTDPNSSDAQIVQTADRALATAAGRVCLLIMDDGQIDILDRRGRLKTLAIAAVIGFACSLGCL